VAEGGTKVVVAPRERPSQAEPSRAKAHTVYAHGTDVLKPAWDIQGQLWLVDRTASGAALSVVHSTSARSVDAPGITGKNVKAFVVSRDGTRLVAVLGDRTGDHLVIARILRDSSGRVRRIADSKPLPVDGGANAPIRDLAWNTPGSVAVLVEPARGTAQVLIAKVDGSSVVGDAASDAELFHANTARIVTSPAPGAPLYVDTGAHQLYQLAATGRWTGTSIKPGIVSPTFVG
jgi:hypothetical protein